MLTLYVKTGCPFCAKVLEAGKELHLNFDTKNVAEPRVADELIAKGGKKQEPYLIDSETGCAMYDSKLIVSYLHEHYGRGKEIAYHPGGLEENNTCPV